MIGRITGAVGCMLLSLASATAAATNSHAELERVARDLAAWLPGEYSTYPQVYLERRLGTMPEGEHGDWYRVFGRIEAPQLAPIVFYSELRSGGPEGVLVGEPLLYVLTIDDAQRAVELRSRRLLDARKLRSVLTRPALWSRLALDPHDVADCILLWRRYGAQLRGIAGEGGCAAAPEGPSQKRRLELEWLLDPDELWILEAGRRDQTHTRFFKARRFDCSAVLAARGRPATRTFSLHDRGGRSWIRQDGGGGEQVELLRGLLPFGDPPQLRRQIWLTLYRQPGNTIVASSMELTGGDGRIALEAGDTQLSCEPAPAGPGGLR